MLFVIVAHKRKACYWKLYLVNPHFYEIFKILLSPLVLVNMLNHRFINVIHRCIHKVSLIEFRLIQCFNNKIFLINPLCIINKTVIEIPFSAKIPYEHYNKKYGCKYSHKCRHLYSEVKCTQKPTYKYYIYNNKYNFKQLIFYIFF